MAKVKGLIANIFSQVRIIVAYELQLNYSLNLHYLRCSSASVVGGFEVFYLFLLILLVMY